MRAGDSALTVLSTLGNSVFYIESGGVRTHKEKKSSRINTISRDAEG